MNSYNTFPNPYKKHLSSEEVLEKRLADFSGNWRYYLKAFVLLQIAFLVFLFTTIITVRFAFLIF